MRLIKSLPGQTLVRAARPRAEREELSAGAAGSAATKQNSELKNKNP